MTTATETPRWHALGVEEVAERLATDPHQGLTSAEAAQRRARYGPNQLRSQAGTDRWELFVRQFSDVLVWVLIAAAVVSGWLLGDLVDAGVIAAIVVLNAVIGFTQEARAEDALRSLEEMAAPLARVVREGEEREIPAGEVVPGDVLVLAAGDLVAADARVVEAVHLTAGEASLTGESLPVAKHPQPVGSEAGVGDRRCMVFAGTVVTTGRGKALVCSTGGSTEMGRIAGMLQEDEPPTPLQVELTRVGRRIGALAGVAAVVVFLLGVARGGETESLFLTAVALAVAAIPEGLPAVNTITLARGVRSMAARNAIVRRLPAVEALGAARVICTDKTGTLTRNEMRVQQLQLAGRRTRPDDEEEQQLDGPLRMYAAVVVLCNDAHRTPEGLVGDPTEVALLASVDPILVSAGELRRRHPRLDELSFDSERKRMATLHPWQEGYLLAVKGAPEVVVELCRQVETSEGVRPLDEAFRRQALDAAAEFGSRGLRTIAVAYRMLAQQPEPLEEAEQDLVLIGVAGMSDDTRPEARPAAETATRAGIEVVMVTGDHHITAQTVAEQLGLLRGRRVMPGTELRRLTVDELEPQVDQIGVYARVDPADKVKIVRAWQRREAIVAMTGDGVNDAPALRAADIGVAMGSGTEVAKQSADMILADDNFASIVAAVEQGRGIFSNLKKVVFFLLSANISEVLVMLAGFMLFGAVGEPLLAVQLLWVNLVTDGLPAVALGMDPPAPDVMSRPPESNRNLVGLQRQLRLLWQGGLLAAGTLTVFAYGHLLRGLPWEEVRSMALTTLVVTQLAFAFVVRAQARSVWEVGLGGNRWLALAVVGSLLLQLAVLYTPFGNHLFEVTPVAMMDWPVLLLAAGLPALAIDRLKALIRARHPDWTTAAD